MTQKYKGFNSKAAFLGFIRSTLRRAWSKNYQPRRDFEQANRIKVPLGRNGALIWGGMCSNCRQLFKQPQLEVDHIVPNHPLTEIEHIGPYCDTNFCEQENMQFTCKPCHKIKTYADRMGITFHQAEAEKKAIAFAKMPVKKQVNLLTAWGRMNEGLTNAKKRREAARLYYIDN